MPDRSFFYNEILKLVRSICIQKDAKSYVMENGKATLQAIYLKRKELPVKFMEDQRIFFRIRSLDYKTFENIKEHCPELLETLSSHFKEILARVRNLSTQLVQAQYTLISKCENKTQSYLNRL